MNSSTWRMIAAALPAVFVIEACRTTPREPGPERIQPATQARSGGASAAADMSRRPHYTAADARFMQGMIAHHAQAVRMAGLVHTRTSNPDVRLIAERIDVAQRDEIKMMQRWLADRGQAVPHPTLVYAPHAGADTSSMAHMPGMSMTAGHETLMPGMLTRAQMARLAAATGTRFDRLFLQGMIHHHQGALAMVDHLFSTPGAAQEPQIFDFVTDVDAGQRAEIDRMRAVLNALPDSASGH